MPYAFHAGAYYAFHARAQARPFAPPRSSAGGGAPPKIFVRFLRLVASRKFPCVFS
jgi:hypothetical protein